MTDMIGESQLEWEKIISALVEGLAELRTQIEETRAEKEKLRADVIEECAAFMERWSDQASLYAPAIRALAKTSED
jgi:hypothetical protein